MTPPPRHQRCPLNGDRTHISGIRTRWSICYAMTTMSCNETQNHQPTVFAFVAPCPTFFQLSQN